jgi:molecular chaperone GrpE
MTEDEHPTANGNGSRGESAEPPASAPAPAGSPEERIATLEAEKTELRDRMLRIAAEFENWKKRSRKEQSDAEGKGRESVLKDVLEVMDNLERAVGAGGTDAQAVLQGVNLVLRLFHSKLERHEVRPVEAQGKPFDPRLHDAISQVPSADVSPGTVLQELQKGYRIGERLLRPASVVVAVAPAGPADGGTKS